MTPAQCRAARGLLDWTQGDLARSSSVSDVTIRNFERGKTALQPASLRVIQLALEAAGVEFINGTGVKLTRS
ncbi:MULTISPECIES: helix-turn-helix domain-containing protein [unclassified Mesorhizobium]